MLRADSNQTKASSIFASAPSWACGNCRPVLAEGTVLAKSAGLHFHFCQLPEIVALLSVSGYRLNARITCLLCHTDPLLPLRPARSCVEGSASSWSIPGYQKVSDKHPRPFLSLSYSLLAASRCLSPTNYPGCSDIGTHGQLEGGAPAIRLLI
jgi:hypothetical protein